MLNTHVCGLSDTGTIFDHLRSRGGRLARAKGLLGANSRIRQIARDPDRDARGGARAPRRYAAVLV
eukprot:COSAG02_NODE_23636_length_712_cov_1.092985_2_plen_65_part_01